MRFFHFRSSEIAIFSHPILFLFEIPPPILHKSPNLAVIAESYNFFLWMSVHPIFSLSAGTEGVQRGTRLTTRSDQWATNRPLPWSPCGPLFCRGVFLRFLCGRLFFWSFDPPLACRGEVICRFSLCWTNPFIARCHFIDHKQIMYL